MFYVQKSWSGGAIGLFKPGRDYFICPHLLDGLALADEGCLTSVHQQFGGERTGVVVGGHGKTIGSGAHQGEVITLSGFGQQPVPAKEIARLTNGAHHVGADERAVPAGQRHDLVISFVKGRTDQVVHGGVHDQEMLSAGALDVFDARDQDASVAGNEPARLHENSQAERFDQGEQAAGVFCGREDVLCGGRFPPGGCAAGQRAVIDDAQAAADAEELQPVFGFEACDHRIWL